MNQILTTGKIYVTPELKRKKKFYRFEFIVSIFLALLLISFYIYAEYDKSKNEEMGRQILSDVSFYTKPNRVPIVAKDDTTIKIESDVMILILDANPTRTSEEERIAEEMEQEAATVGNQAFESNVLYSEGMPYYTTAILKIPRLNKNFAILSRTSDALLKISPTKFWGPEPNEVGNFCIVGHNYHDTRFFSQVPDLEKGDTIELTDKTGNTITYELYNKYTVDPTDVSCTTQRTNGKREVTLITCTKNNKKRVITKFREI